MGVNGAQFGSNLFYIPGSYSKRKFIANEGGGVSAGNIAVLGFSDLGEPQALLVFSDSDEAKIELKSGNLVDGIRATFKPGSDLTPQEVGAVRVNPGTQSSRFLKKSAVNRFKALSYSWGVPMNQIRLKFSAGTVAGTHKLETEFQGVTNEQDDIEKKSLDIQYTGAGSAGVMTIDATSLATTITAGPGGEELTLLLADYPTISELQQVINNNPAYTATLLADEATDPSGVIDAVTAIDIHTAPYVIKSDYQAVFDALKLDSFLGEITKEGIIRDLPDVDAEFIYLSGGTSGTLTTQNFADALAVLEEEDIQLVGTTSEDAAVHQLIKDHCVKMSAIDGRKERQYYVGGALNETDDQVVARAKVLNSSLGALCSPGYTGFDENGDERFYSSAYYACQQLGMVSSLPLNTPTTSKAPNIISWEKTYNRTAQKKLIRGGVLCGAKNQDGGFITVRSVSTFQGSILQQNEMSIMRETLYQDADLRRRTEKALVGTPNVGNDQLATVDTVFERTIKDWKGLEIIVPDGINLYTGYTRKINGDAILISYNTNNTSPTNFVFTTHNISVLRQ